MGRHTLNNCDYFAHKNSMRNHRKVKALRNKFDKPGAPIGYAFWSMFLEYLTGLDGNEMEYNDLECEMFAAELGIVSETIREMIEFSIKIELLFNKNGFIHSISLDEELAPVYEKRKKSKEASAARRRRDDGKYISTSKSNGEVDDINAKILGIVSTEMDLVSETKPHSIVEYSIEENSIEEDIPPVFVQCKKFFSEWYQDKEKTTCDFDVADNVALHRIIKRLEKQFKQVDILSEFKKVFENWNSWDKLHQDKLKFSQIEYYWQNIIESIQQEKNKAVAESFERFWNIYDKNIGRISCERLWIRLSQEDRDSILDYVPKYVLSTPNKQFRSNPQTFLDEKMWFNEIIMPQLNGHKNGHSKKASREDVNAAIRRKLGR